MSRVVWVLNEIASGCLPSWSSDLAPARVISAGEEGARSRFEPNVQGYATDVGFSTATAYGERSLTGRTLRPTAPEPREYAEPRVTDWNAVILSPASPPADGRTLR